LRALIIQDPPSRAEVWKEDKWQAWVDPVAMSTWPRPYALCEDAQSDDPADYEITEVREETEEGVTVRRVAEARA